MKKILMVLIIVMMSLGAFAQHRPVHRPVQRPHVRSHVVVVGRPYYRYYDPFFDPFYSPYYRYGYFPRESKLDLKVDDIRADYNDKIWSARHDKSLSKAERRKIVHDLKREREHAINEAKRNYYRS